MYKACTCCAVLYFFRRIYGRRTVVQKEGRGGRHKGEDSCQKSWNFLTYPSWVSLETFSVAVSCFAIAYIYQPVTMWYCFNARTIMAGLRVVIFGTTARSGRAKYVHAWYMLKLEGASAILRRSDVSHPPLLRQLIYSLHLVTLKWLWETSRHLETPLLD